MQLTYGLLQVDKYNGTCKQDIIKLLSVFLKLKVIVIQNISECQILECERVQANTMFKVIQRSSPAWTSWTRSEVWVRISEIL